MTMPEPVAPTAEPPATEPTVPSTEPNAAPQVDLLGGVSLEPTEPGTEPNIDGNWYDNFGDDYKDNPNITKYKTQEDFLKGHLNLASLAGKKGLQPLGEGATPEEVAAYRQCVGCPESADGYEWESPTVEVTDPETGVVTNEPMLDLNPELMKETMQVFHDKNMTNDQVKSVMDMFAQYQHDAVQNGVNEFAASQEEEARFSQAQLSKEWGHDYTNKLNAVNNVINKFGLADTLKDLGLANNYKVVKMFESMIDKVGEGRITGDMSDTGGGFEASLQEIMNNDDYWNPGSPNYKALRARVDSMHRQRYS